MTHYFVLVLLFRGLNTFNPAATTVGNFYSPQSCIEAREVALQRAHVVDAFCVQVDREISK